MGFLHLSQMASRTLVKKSDPKGEGRVKKRVRTSLTWAMGRTQNRGRNSSSQATQRDCNFKEDSGTGHSQEQLCAVASGPHGR